MEKNNKNSESVQTAPEQKIIEIAINFVKKTASEFIGKPDYLVKILHINNGLVLRFIWTGECFIVDLYDDKFNINICDGYTMDELEDCYQYIREAIIEFYERYIDFCVEEREDIFFTGCGAIMFDKRKKMYYRFEKKNDGYQKVWVNPYDWAVEKSNSTKLFWLN